MVRAISQPPTRAPASTLLLLGSTLVLSPGTSLGGELAAQPAPLVPAAVVVLSPSSSEALLVDPTRNRVLARLPTGPEPWDFALSADGRFAYVSSYGWAPPPGDPADRATRPEEWTSTPPGRRGVTVIDRHALRIHTVFQPRDYRGLGAIVAGEAGDRLWVTSEAENGVVELDARSGEVRMLWKTGGKGAADLAVSDDENLLFTANAESDDVTVIDRMTVVSTRISTGSRPAGLAVAPFGKELWVANSGDNTVSVVRDFRSPREVRQFSSGGLEPVRIAFHDTRREAWISHRASRTVTVLAMASGERIAEVVLPGEPRDITFSDDETRAYVSSPDGRRVYTIDVASRRLEDPAAPELRGSGGA